MKKLSQKALGKKVSRLYALSCSGVQVSIWDMGKITRVAEESIQAGDSDEVVQTKIRAFVETIRKN